jgi:hypothetical protein
VAAPNAGHSQNGGADCVHLQVIGGLIRSTLARLSAAALRRG